MLPRRLRLVRRIWCRAITHGLASLDIQDIVLLFLLHMDEELLSGLLGAAIGHRSGLEVGMLVSDVKEKGERETYIDLCVDTASVFDEDKEAGDLCGGE